MDRPERERIILALLDNEGYVSSSELTRRLFASVSTIHRDLSRLQLDGKVRRVRGGVAAIRRKDESPAALKGAPFRASINLNRVKKDAIGKAAARLCSHGEAIIIGSGSTTLCMCRHLKGMKLHVLTNSLHIVNGLLPCRDVSVSIHGGFIFRDQNVVLDPLLETSTAVFHASKMFLSAAAVTRSGAMQSDMMLVQAERKLIGLADEIVLLADSSKFPGSAPYQLCDLQKVHTVVTDTGISEEARNMLESAGIHVIAVRD